MEMKEVRRQMVEIADCLHQAIEKLGRLERELDTEFVIRKRTIQNFRHNQEILEGRRNK